MIDLRCGNNLDLLPTLADCSVDACVCDPPYELGFMGKRWDSSGIAYSVDLWRQVLRVLKPGGHLIAFGGTRTYHRMTCAIEDAGFEVRDCLGWLYGSGFPKSLDVSKAIDQRERGRMVREKLMHFAKARGVDGKWLEAHGVASASSFTDWTVGGHVPSDRNWQLVKVALGVTPEEEAAFEREVVGQKDSGLDKATGNTVYMSGCKTRNENGLINITAPATDAAKQWQGWGTALKPAWEPAVLARKPLDGTVAANVLAHGCGALNVDGCRVGDEEQGRWPANILHDGSDEAEAVFPDDASRFFYSAKTSTWEREAGLDDLPRRTAGELTGRKDGSAGLNSPRSGAGASSKDGRANIHPTVKPVDLMRWLVRLVTPPGGTVLDPFAGSGSTGMAAVLEGASFIGLELDPHHVEIARRRIEAARQRTIVVRDGKVAPSDVPTSQQALPW